MKIDKKLLKEEVLNEISYKRFMNEVEKVSGKTKKKRSLTQMKKALKEIETIFTHINKLNESETEVDGYWENNQQHLNEISNRMIEIGLKIRKLGKK